MERLLEIFYLLSETITWLARKGKCAFEPVSRGFHLLQIDSRDVGVGLVDKGCVGHEGRRTTRWFGTHVQRHAWIGYPFLLLLACAVYVSISELRDSLVEKVLYVFTSRGVFEEDSFVNV